MPIKAIIGVYGPMGSGKSTLAQGLADTLPDAYRTHHFAFRLKSDMVNFTGIALNEATKDAYRVGLQWYGVFMRQMIHPDYWVNQLLDQIHHSWDTDYQPVVVVVDDMRFANEKAGLEAEAIRRDIPFISIKLGVDEAHQIERRGQSAAEARNHVSETELAGDWDFDLFINTSPLTAEGVRLLVVGHLIAAGVLDAYTLRLVEGVHNAANHLLPDDGGTSEGVQDSAEPASSLPGD